MKLLKKTAPQNNSNSLNCKKTTAPQYSSAQRTAIKKTITLTIIASNFVRGEPGVFGAVKEPYFTP